MKTLYPIPLHSIFSIYSLIIFIQIAIITLHDEMMLIIIAFALTMQYSEAALHIQEAVFFLLDKGGEKVKIFSGCKPPKFLLSPFSTFLPFCLLFSTFVASQDLDEGGES